MIIEGDFYKIKPIDNCSCLFDLELLYEIKGKNPRKEFKNVGYGMPMHRVLEKMISYSVTNKLPDTATLKDYLNAFKEESNTIRTLLKDVGF